MRTLVLLFFAVSAVLALAVQPIQKDRAAYVGVAVSLDGDFAAAGEMYKKGLRAWEADVNARGGLLNRKVELVIHNDASDPARTAEIYAELASEGGPELLLGPVNTYLALAAMPALERAQTPCVFPAGSSHAMLGLNARYVFGMQPPLSEWSAGFFEIASRAGLKSVALLVADHPLAQVVLDNSAKWAKRYGLELTMSVSVDLDSLQAATDQVLRARTDAVAVWSNRSGCLLAQRLLRRDVWKPKAVFLSSNQGLPGARHEAGADMEGVFTATAWDARMAGTYPGGARFLELFRGQYKQEPDSLAAAAYAGGQLLESAVIKAQGFDKGTIRDVLKELDTVTIIGRYGVDPSGVQLRQYPLTLQWQKSKREIVWPEEIRTARPVLAR